MYSPFSLELYADAVMRDRALAAQQAALAAQLPRKSFSNSALAARLRLARGLRALAARLDPCEAAQASLVVATSR